MLKVILLLTVALLGCSKEKEIIRPLLYSNQMVQEYIVPTGVEFLKHHYYDNVLDIENFVGVEFSFTGESVLQSSLPNDLFLATAQKFGDTHYNRVINPPFFYQAVGSTIKSIKVTSDRDIDGYHPAGASLNDLVGFIGYSLYPYVNSGYRELSSPEFVDPTLAPYQRVTKMLDELSPEDLKLLDPEFILDLSNQELRGELTMTCEFDNGTSTSTSFSREPPIGGGYYSQELIQAYTVPQKMECYGEDQTIWLYISGDEILQGGSTAEAFKVIAEKYGDTYYNNYLPVAYANRAFSLPITAINITSDLAFDARHPAGVSLNDLVRLNAQSLYYFIKDGYQNSRPNTPEFINDYLYGWQYVSMRLDKLRLEELNLLNAKSADFIELEFLTMPPSGEHTFTITCRFDKQAPLTSTIKIVYE